MALPSIATPTYELELPSTKKKIKYRPFLVKEEKVLLLATQSTEPKEVLDAVRQITKSCVLSRIKLESLTSFDLEYLFLKIRAASVGEDVPMKITCLDDNQTKVDYVVDLSTVKVEIPEGHSTKIELTDNVGMIMRYPGMDEFVNYTMLGQTPDDPDEIFGVIAKCIDQIYEGDDVFDESTTTEKEKVHFIESLTQKQFESVQKFFNTMPVLRHKFEITNPNTNVTSSYTLEGLQSFFG
jgi:hypothetical protein